MIMLSENTEAFAVIDVSSKEVSHPIMTSSSNTLTLSYPSNSQGVSLGSSVSFAIAINQNGSIFTFVESIKF